MPAQKQPGKRGSRKIGTSLVKCAAWRMHHGGGSRKHFIKSHEHRDCGPLGYHNREENIKKAARRARILAVELVQVDGDVFKGVPVVAFEKLPQKKPIYVAK